MLGSLALPDGYFLPGDVTMWSSSVAADVPLSRGYRLEVPDLSVAGRDRRLEMATRTASFLAGLGEHRVQLQWERTSDFRAGLDRFRRLTIASMPPWHERARRRREEALRAQMESGQARRERLTLWVARAPGAALPASGFANADALDLWMQTMGRTIDDAVATLALRLPSGSSVLPMTAEEQFRAIRRHLQPGIPVGLDDSTDSFDPTLSILDNCLGSDLAGARLQGGEGAGFVLNGYYHAVLVLRGWPNSFFPGMMTSLLRASVKDYRVTQTLRPRRRERELSLALDRLKKLRAKARREPGQQSLLEDLEARVRDLQSGVTQPFDSTTIVTVWDATQEGLLSKVGALRLALAGSGNAQVHLCSQFAQAFRLFSETLPGRLSVRPSGWELTEEAHRIARSLCLSSSYVGALEEADAIYPTDQGGIAGVRLFRNGQPQHSVLVGKTGSGKSVFTVDLASQAAATVDFMVIVEEGMSHFAFARVAGLQTVIVRPNGGVTLNPLNTAGAPLTGEAISMVAGLLAKMADLPLGTDDGALRRSILAEYIGRHYSDTAHDWLTNDEKAEMRLAAESRLIEAWRQNMPDSAGFLEAWRDSMDYREAHPEEWANALRSYEDDSAGTLLWYQSDLGRRLTESLVFAQPNAPEAQLRPLVDALLSHLEAKEGTKEADSASLLGRKLEEWCSQGPYGALFDGPSSIDPKAGRGLHFELGRIPGGQARLKDVVAFYLANFVRDRVASMPRALRKLAIFEEAKRFQAIPEGRQFIEEGYEQMRKFGCCVMSSFQSLRQVSDPSLLSALVNNASNFFLLSQQGGVDLDLLASAIRGLPEPAVQLIASFPTPSSLPEGQRASYVLHAETGAGELQCGVLRVTVDQEMQWVSRSDGEHYDQIAAAFQAYGDPIDCVRTEAFLASQPAGVRRMPDGRIEILHT